MLRPWISRLAPLALVSLAACWGLLSAGSGETLEYKVKAGYLWNFAKFIDWPAQILPENAPITICVLGTDPFGDVLEQTVRDKIVLGHTFTVRRSPKAQVISGCHIAFLACADQKKLADLAQAAASSGALTVGESRGFAELGGMIGFVIDHNRVRFEINPGLARLAGLHISSELLKLSENAQK